jgi:hypothetical protein
MFSRNTDDPSIAGPTWKHGNFREKILSKIQGLSIFRYIRTFIQNFKALAVI